MHYLENSTHSKAELDRICCSWLTIVEDLREENALLIRLLAAVLSTTVTQEFVETAEKYQARFLIVEEGLLLLRHEIGEQRQWLKGKQKGTNPHSPERLQRDIDRTELDFVTLRANFLQFAGVERS
ncbi:hypothetical protein SAMN05444266_102634 [Chitinophaga jiangningensis]|uniref:Uncharacterized protein n=1 Tax=Chitinophaga jiangningensis TaxID=1419482 RepID=A0A1M6Z6Q6_9BACT|nr:hypothetical protein [Chitinophaga jiangningensis]SHL26095.1 hypothetical protein SAMN05444266_102634 [Chitinophaga jiangningensis]